MNMNDLVTVFEGLIDNADAKVVFYLMKNRNEGNIVIATYEKVAEECRITVPTVSTTFKKLYDKEFITKISNGVYQINPDQINLGY